MNVELFPCSGGMAEGFRRASVTFDLAFDVDADACASYEANHGHRPIQMDARDLLRMVRAGWQPAEYHGISPLTVTRTIAQPLDLLVADPPCTPWSRAGKRLGVDDERDMLLVTIELVRLLRPRAYLIGNVPGLDDAPNWPTLQRALAPLATVGYCIADYAALDAANYGVPQHRVRPFWFGHLDGPCIRWPAPTHGDPASPSVHSPLPGMALQPWVTCREALGYLPPEQLGRPVKMRRRDQNSPQHGSVPDRPARVVGTSNLSDGNVLVPTDRHRPIHPDAPAPTITGGGDGHAARQHLLTSEPAAPQERRTPRTPQSQRAQETDEPARTVRGSRSWGAGQINLNPKHPPNDPDKPSPTIAAKSRMQSGEVMELTAPVAERAKRTPSTQGEQWSRVHTPDAPAPTVLTDTDRKTGNGVKLEWPWDRPSTTVQRDERIAPPGHKPENWGALISGPDAIVLSERAAAILQGFPDGCRCEGESWAKQDRSQQGPTVVTSPSMDISDEVTRSSTAVSGERCTARSPLDTTSITATATSKTTGRRTSKRDRTAPTRASIVDAASTVMSGSSSAHAAALSPPWPPTGTSAMGSLGDTNLATNDTSPSASVVCERCGERRRRWTFAGKTKTARWSQIGQAMPPALAEAVARAVMAQMAAAKGRAA
jgi:site-specific DNA-cytosine methylase